MDKLVPVYKSGVYREFKAMNFGDLLKAWPSLYRYNCYECISFFVIDTEDNLISIHAIEMQG